MSIVGAITIGERFGRWTVTGSRKGTSKRPFHPCLCDCGTERDVSSHCLARGGSLSCGCLQMDVVTKHGHTIDYTRTRLYTIWNKMRRRCRDPREYSYRNYGGKGITVCREWDEDFRVFRDWAESHGYRNDLTIDRIDSSRGYNPENCRWLTVSENCRNNSHARWIEAFGETKTLTQWVNDPRCKVSHGTLWKRLTKENWDVEPAILIPAKPSRFQRILPPT